MKLIERWNAYMGPKDERLVAENNRCMRVGYIILLAGAAIAAYYGIMIDQVASTTETDIYTAVGQNIFPASSVALVALMISCFVTLGLEMKAGIMDEHVRIATINHVPWDFCAIVGLIGGALLGIITAGTRMLAEWQIVGAGNIAWAGDVAMGVVFFVMAFALGTFFTAAFFRSAIKSRQKQEAELED